MTFIADRAMYNEFGQDETQLNAFIRNLITTVNNRIMSHINLHLVANSVIIWKDEDKVRHSEQKTSLEQWRTDVYNYVKTEFAHYDMVMAITGVYYVLAESFHFFAIRTGVRRWNRRHRTRNWLCLPPRSGGRLSIPNPA